MRRGECGCKTTNHFLCSSVPVYPGKAQKGPDWPKRLLSTRVTCGERELQCAGQHLMSLPQ